MDVVGIGLFFGASIIAGTFRDGYFDWLLPAREQPPNDPPPVTVVHHTVKVTRGIVRTTPSFVTVFESVPTYITLAAEPYHKIWSLSWTDLLQCFGPFLIFLLFILLMLWWLGHDDTADTAPVDGADSPSPPSSPQPSGAKSLDDTKHESPGPREDTAQSVSSSESPSSTGSTRIGTGFFRRPESAQLPQGPLTRFGRRPIIQPRRISRGTATAGQASSAGPAAVQPTSASETRNALRDAITFGRASRFTAGASHGVQDTVTESNNVGASRSSESEVSDTSESSSNAATDRLPPYVPPRRRDPNHINRSHIVDPDASRVIIDRDGAQPRDISGQGLSSAPPSSRPSPSDRSPAQQHAQGMLNSADPITPAVDAARPLPESPHRSIDPPLSNIPQQVLPHSGSVGSALGPISEETSAQDGNRQIPNSPVDAVPDDDSDLIEFSGLQPEQEDNLPDHAIDRPNVIQQRAGEVGLLSGDSFPVDQPLNLEDGASNGTLEDFNRLGSAPQDGARSEYSESSTAGSNDEEDDENLDFEDVLASGQWSQILAYVNRANPPEQRASEQVENLLITVPEEQRAVDDEDTGDAVDSASEETSNHEDEQDPEDAAQSEDNVPSRSPGQAIGPDLATPVTSPAQTTNTAVPSSQPAASPVTPQRSIASDEHDELYYATPEAEQRRRTRDLAISRSLAETLSGFGGPAGPSGYNATRSEETNSQEQGFNAAILPAYSSGATVPEVSEAEQAAPIETRSRPLYADFIGQTGALRTSATSSEPRPSSLPADVWSSRPFPAPTPISSTTNGIDRGEETYPLSRRRIAQSQISMQGHTPQRVDDFSSPSAGESQDSSSSGSQAHQESRHLLTLPHPAREETFEYEMPSVRDVDNNPHFWAPGERSQARRLRELPRRDPRHLPILESALDSSTPLRGAGVATRDFGTSSSPEDELVQPSSTALADPFTEADSEPSASREARGSIAFSIPPLSNRAGNDETNAENGDDVPEAQEDSSQQQASQQAATEPTTPPERIQAGNPVTPNTASSAATQIITSPHPGTYTRDCPHWISGNFCADYQCPLTHDPEKLKRDRNGKIICSYFLKGRCSRGSACSKSHDTGDQNGDAIQQPVSTAPIVPTQASQGPQAPQVVAGPSRLVPQPVPAAPAAPAQAVQEPLVPEAAAGSRNSTQQPASNGQVLPAQAARQTEASQPAGRPSRSVPRNEDEQVDDMMATMSTGVSTSMWANNNRHGRRRSRPANRASNSQAQPRPADVQAQSAIENSRSEGTAARSVTAANDQGDHNSVPQNAASNSQSTITAMEPDAGSDQNGDQIAVAEDAASSTQLDSAPAEPATASSDNLDEIVATHNAAPNTQPGSIVPEPATASSDISGQSAGPQDAAPDTQPDSAAADPVATSNDHRDRSATPRSAVPNLALGSAPPEPVATSNDNGDNHAATQNADLNLRTGSAHPDQATTSNNNGTETAVLRDHGNAASRVQRDPEERAVNALTASMASGTSQSMWADDETEEPTDTAPVVDQPTQVSSEAQVQQTEDANENEIATNGSEQEAATNVVDNFHRATLPEDDDRAGRERFFLASIADLEELIEEDKRFIAQNSGSKNKQMQSRANTKQMGLGAKQSQLRDVKNKLLQLRQQQLKGPPKQANQPQQSAGAQGAASDQPTARPQEESGGNQDAKEPKGKEKQTYASLNDDSHTSAAAPMPGQESLWSDTNYVAPPKQNGKGKEKQKQQQQKKPASEASTTATVATSSALPQGNNTPPAQPQSSASNEPSASTQAATAAQTSAHAPASGQDQVSEGSQVPGNARAATNLQSSSDDIAASTPHVNGNDPPETGSAGTSSSSAVPGGSSQPDSANTNYRRVNTALVPDYTTSKSAQNAVRSLGEKRQVAEMREAVKDAKPFRWEDEFDDTEKFTAGPELKPAERAPQHQTPISAQDTSGNPPRQPTPSKPEEQSQAISSVQPPSKAEQKLMNQIQRLEEKNLNDQALMQQCLSSGNVSKAKQLQEQDIPYNEAGLLQLRANLEKINPGNPLLQQNGAQGASTSQPTNATAQSLNDAGASTGVAGSSSQSEDAAVPAANVQANKPTNALSESIWVTDAPDDDALRSAPHQPVVVNDTAEQQSENAAAQTSNVEDELPRQGIADSRWAKFPDVDLSKPAPRKKAASTTNAGPSNQKAKGSGNNTSKGKADNGSNGSGNNGSNGSGNNGSNGSGNNGSNGSGNNGSNNAGPSNQKAKGSGNNTTKGKGNNGSNGSGNSGSNGNGNNSKGDGKNKKKKGNGKKK